MQMIAAVACALLAMLLPASALAQGERANQPVMVEVMREAGMWTATFSLPSDQPIWAFQRSSLTRRGGVSWRPDSWRIATPGVSLERIGDFDALVGQGGAVPRTVTVDFTPVAVDLQADYDPAVILSNGSLALFSGHFMLFPMAETAALAALDAPGNHPVMIRMQDDGAQVIYHGETWDSVNLQGSGYVVFGPVDLIESAHVTAITDPGLPAWLADELSSFTKAAFARYTELLGPHRAGKPSLMASWAGPTPETISLGGSVTNGMVTMRFEGVGLVEREAGALERSQWFIAHEAAHFWLGQAVSYETMDEMWITEGGADLMALRLQGDLTRNALAGGAFPAGEGLADDAERCAGFLPKGPLKDARRRQEHDAYYACGVLIALAVEQAGTVRGEDFFTFLVRLIAANPDTVVTRDEWFAEATAFGLSTQKAELIESWLDHGSKDPLGEIEQLVGALVPSEAA